MPSGASPVEQLLDRWEERNPDSPVRAVVERAGVLGFEPVLPTGSSAPTYLRLVHGDATLYVNALRLTAVGARTKELTAALPGAKVGTRDVQLPFDSTDPFAVLETVLFGVNGRPAPTLVQPDVAWPPVPVAVGAEPAPRRRTALVVAAAVVAAGLVALVAGAATAPHTVATSATSAPSASSSAPAPASTSAAAEAAVRSAESTLLDDESTSGAAPAALDATTGLLADGAADTAITDAQPGSALAALGAVPVKGRAPQTGYSRDQFGAGWVDTDHNGCDTRNDVLARDLTGKTFKPGTHDCVVLTGTLLDPYSGRTIAFQRGQTTSEAVQIDHVVALSDAWQTGAQGWDAAQRTAFANDPLNLLAVDGPLNEQKGDGDAATWLPPNTSARCAYVARQVSVKVRYGLWTTRAERDAIATVLTPCPLEPLAGGVVAVLPKTAPTTAARAAATPAPQPALVVPAPVQAPGPTPKPSPKPIPEPTPQPATRPEPQPVGTTYANCAAARAAGAAPLHAGEPGYSRKLDRDGDGVACEK